MMKKEYDFLRIEAKWQKYWEDHELFKVTEDPSVPREKRLYILDMFPYPSAEGLHVGHPLGYTATDIFARFKRSCGYHVLHPMGFDSFGLPAENYAIQTGQHPQVTTQENIQRFRQQIRALGFSYDWSREIQTHHQDYYRWTQWIFLKLYQKDLVYEDEIAVWYCPELKTVLANEEVLLTKQGPRSERGGHPVERRPLRQWMLRITAYAQRLLDDLEELDWPESVKAMQRHWIGRSEGVQIRFATKIDQLVLEIFTSRADTLYGVTYLVLSPEHPAIKRLVQVEYQSAVEEYLRSSALKSELERAELNLEKTGVFTGSYAIHPLSQELLPIWIGDYVLPHYGTGAVMAVPAHDQRDFDFAKRYDLPFRWVISPSDQKQSRDHAYTEEGLLMNSGVFSGKQSPQARELIIAFLEEHHGAQRKINFRLRDWIFSRQRYWGEPIPLVRDEEGNIFPLDEKDLPLELPSISDFKPSLTGESPLSRAHEWLCYKDPQSGKNLTRDSNTMPQWAGSCWYYLRYIDPCNRQHFADKEKLDYWLPVDLYVGGAEHSVLHLLYARFWHKVLYDLELVPGKEPFARLVNQGMITSYAYQNSEGRLIPNDQVSEENQAFFDKKTGEKLSRIVAKMSKSLKNVVNPDDIIAHHGADTMRLYTMFMGPLSESKPWNTQGLSGLGRFLLRVWNIATLPPTEQAAPESLVREVHKTIAKVSHETQRLAFNTAIAALMSLSHLFAEEKWLYPALWEKFLLLLGPYAPHIAEELWEALGHQESILLTPWPQAEEEFLTQSHATIVVQVNGKLRAQFSYPLNASQAELEQHARQLDRVQTALKEGSLVKTIFVSNKLLNFVLKKD